jgi:two-component system sensor histidine kinase KdpD
VKIEADGATVGSLWATRPTAAGEPNREETRLLALAADPLGLAVHRDELAAAATAAEVARQSDALKSALLTSVSHDLRTPLAGIRAAAGSLMDPDVPWSAEGMRATARTIDAEADRLNRLVRNLLDLSRIEAGVLRPDLEALDVEDLVDAAVRRAAPLFTGRQVEIDLPDGLPAVRADAVFLDEALANLLENAARHAGPQARVRVAGAVRDDGHEVVLAVEDSGPGVAADALSRIFEKFQRGGRDGRDPDGSRRGMGIGLSVVRGFVEAMGGTVHAGRSAGLGGLRVEIDLPTVEVPGDVREPARIP